MSAPKSFKIALLPGDGIGPEVLSEAVRVMDRLASLASIKFETGSYPFGGNAIDSHGDPLPKETLEACKGADAILFGAISALNLRLLVRTNMRGLQRRCWWAEMGHCSG